MRLKIVFLTQITKIGQDPEVMIIREIVWVGADGPQELQFVASESDYKLGSSPKLHC